jgi:hypothetical protein
MSRTSESLETSLTAAGFPARPAGPRVLVLTARDERRRRPHAGSGEEVALGETAESSTPFFSQIRSMAAQLLLSPDPLVHDVGLCDFDLRLFPLAGVWRRGKRSMSV